MRFQDHSVTQVSVGLFRVGLAGLHDALKSAAASGLQDRADIVALIMQDLTERNYIPTGQLDAYRTAVWREYLRHQGADFSAFYSEVPVIVRGVPGEERQRFFELVTAALAGHEFRPLVTYEAESSEGPNPQLAIAGETVVRGMCSPTEMRRAIRASLSHW